jgi:hypothetical protein
MPRRSPAAKGHLKAALALARQGEEQDTITAPLAPLFRQITDAGVVAVKRAPFLLRIAAVVSSVLLASGIVAHNAGAFDWFQGTKAPTAEKSHTPAPTEKPPEKPEPYTFTFVPYTPSEKQSPRDTKPVPTIMSGSKVKFTPVITIQPPSEAGAKPSSQEQSK